MLCVLLCYIFVQTLLRVCALIVTRLAIVRPALCDAVLLLPLAAPLLSVLAPANTTDDSGSVATATILPVETAVSYTRPAYVYDKYLEQAAAGNANNAAPMETITIGTRDDVVTSPACLTASVELLHALLTLCPVHSALLNALHRCGVAHAMLRLYAHVCDTTTTEEFRRTVEEWCVIYLRHYGTRALPLLMELLCSPGRAAINGFHTNAAGEVEVRRVTAQSTAPPELTVHSIVQQVAVKETHHGADTEGDALMAALTRGHSLVAPILKLLNILDEGYMKRQAYELERQATTAAGVKASHASAASTSSSSRNKAGTVTGGTTVNNVTATGGTTTPLQAYKGYEFIVSELFLRCLSGFLQLPHETVHTKGSGNPDVVQGTAMDTVSPAQYGLVMLQLQEGLPSTALLRDGKCACYVSFLPDVSQLRCTTVLRSFWLVSKHGVPLLRVAAFCTTTGLCALRCFSCRRDDTETTQDISGGKCHFTAVTLACFRSSCQQTFFPLQWRTGTSLYSLSVIARWMCELILRILPCV
jgi:hypothetical protein